MRTDAQIAATIARMEAGVSSHRELYPEQYTHPLVGKNAVIVQNGKELTRGTVERVVESRFGQLAQLDTDPADTFWGIGSVIEVGP